MVRELRPGTYPLKMMSGGEWVDVGKATVRKGGLIEMEFDPGKKPYPFFDLDIKDFNIDSQKEKEKNDGQ